MVKIYKKKRLRVLLRFFSVLFLGLFLIFSVIHLYLGQTLRAVEDQYIEETAILYVKNINRKIQSINQEFLMLANNLRNTFPASLKISVPGTVDTTTFCLWPATSLAA